MVVCAGLESTFARSLIVCLGAANSAKSGYTLTVMSSSTDLERLNTARLKMAIRLTVAMMVFYFGFILLFAFRKSLLTMLVSPGLSLGMLLGALVIVAAWVLVWIYVRWANRHYDQSIADLREQL